MKHIAVTAKRENVRREAAELNANAQYELLAELKPDKIDLLRALLRKMATTNLPVLVSQTTRVLTELERTGT